MIRIGLILLLIFISASLLQQNQKLEEQLIEARKPKHIPQDWACYTASLRGNKQKKPVVIILEGDKE